MGTANHAGFEFEDHNENETRTTRDRTFLRSISHHLWCDPDAFHTVSSVVRMQNHILRMNTKMRRIYSFFPRGTAAQAKAMLLRIA